MNKETLKKIIENHQHFLNKDIDGWENMRANLRGANLELADLRGANLQYADLKGAYLYGADLEGANLCGANLIGADFYHANLRDAYLSGANLTEAIFDYANLNDAHLDKEEEFRKGVILSESIIGWKICMNRKIVELEIPMGAIVFCINGKKCRTNKCKVLSISKDYVAHSLYDNSFTYKIGKKIEINNFDLRYNVECGNGIHFFKNREDAETF